MAEVDQAEPAGESVEKAGQTTEAAEKLEGLTELERGVLAIEKKRWRYQGSKEQAIVKTLGINATRYYQILNALLDDERVLAAEPLLVKRLAAQREL